jgi:hypothetical protein
MTPLEAALTKEKETMRKALEAAEGLVEDSRSMATAATLPCPPLEEEDGDMGYAPRRDTYPASADVMHARRR